MSVNINPFIVSGRIPEAYFCDRVEESLQLEQSLTNQLNVVLTSSRRMGKTSLAMNLVENIALSGKSCAVFSLEMSKEQLVQRMLCAVANVSMSNALKGQMQKSEWLKIAKAKEMLSNTRIFIDESSVITPEEILSKCRRLKRTAVMP